MHFRCHVFKAFLSEQRISQHYINYHTSLLGPLFLKLSEGS